VSPTALLFEQATQYKISKIKLSISTIAVTRATESTKASLACHSYLFESGVAPFLRGQAFDPETVKAIGNALIITCETLGVERARRCLNPTYCPKDH
jgi:hypothetical protein